MYNKMFALALLGILFHSCCKEDDIVVDDSCKETREFWLDGSIGDHQFVTSEPCGEQYLMEDSVWQRFYGHYPGIIFNSRYEVRDSISRGFITIFIGADIDSALLDTVITGNDTVINVASANLGLLLNMGPLYLYAFQAYQNNTNSYHIGYTDEAGRNWSLDPSGFCSFAIQAIEGAKTVAPLNGEARLYCPVKCEFSVRMVDYETHDTLRLQGSGRVGFR